VVHVIDPRPLLEHDDARAPALQKPQSDRATGHTCADDDDINLVSR
jgi:hypothetical protein